eukprot:scaffold11027_cov73-Skeletonema_marinoi.AAC.2
MIDDERLESELQASLLLLPAAAACCLLLHELGYKNAKSEPSRVGKRHIPQNYVPIPSVDIKKNLDGR